MADMCSFTFLTLMAMRREGVTNLRQQTKVGCDQRIKSETQRSNRLENARQKWKWLDSAETREQCWNAAKLFAIFLCGNDPTTTAHS